MRELFVVFFLLYASLAKTYAKFVIRYLQDCLSRTYAQVTINI